MNVKHKIRVVMADDQRILREGLRIILDADSDIAVVGEAEDGETAVKLALSLQPDVLLMDIRMPILDGIAATAQICKALPNVHIILLTTYDTPELLVKGLQAGAIGFILKDCTAEELCNAIRIVGRGQPFLQATSAIQLLSNLPLPTSPQQQSPAETLGLTDREMDVLHLMVRGQTNNEIALELSVTEATVKTHISHILAKLGARDRTHVVVLVHQLGLLDSIK